MCHRNLLATSFVDTEYSVETHGMTKFNNSGTSIIQILNGRGNFLNQRMFLVNEGDF